MILISYLAASNKKMWIWLLLIYERGMGSTTCNLRIHHSRTFDVVGKSMTPMMRTISGFVWGLGQRIVFPPSINSFLEYVRESYYAPQLHAYNSSILIHVCSASHPWCSFVYSQSFIINTIVCDLTLAVVRR